MSGETKANISAWNVSTLREYGDHVDRLSERIIALRELTDERDRLYKERDEARRTAVDAALAAAKAAVDAALIAVKEQTKASFEASEKAIVKAEEAQKAYNQAHNDLARKMDEQNKATMPRSETEARFRAQEEKINDLRESRSAAIGTGVGAKSIADVGRANIALILSFIGLVAMAVRTMFGG